ncbi:MAG: 6-bladed beta-propeller [Bacteroidaceae bacterium]|nr:6-bladed beta-propeller [Bacteroidaceae bacterium]
MSTIFIKQQLLHKKIGANHLHLFISILIFAFLCVGCHSETSQKQNSDTQSKIIKLDISNLSNYREIEKFNLSEAAKNIRIVPLETKGECLISKIDNIIIADSSIIINDNQKIYRFDMNGKFMNIIGKIGEGPEEYINLSQIEYGEKDKGIYCFATKGIKIYNMDGTYRKTLSTDSITDTDYRGGKYNYVMENGDIILNSKLPVLKALGSKDLWTFSIFDNNMNLKIKIYNQDILNHKDFINNNVAPMMGWVNYCTEDFALVDFYKGFKTAYYGGDTIYRYNQNNLEPVYILKTGEKPTFELSHQWIKRNDFFKYLWMTDFFDSERYFYLLMGKSSNLYTIRYDKSTKEICYTKTESNIKRTNFPGSPDWVYQRRTDFFTLTNDLSGGLPFNVQFKRNSKYWIDEVNSSELKEKIKPTNLQNKKVKEEYRKSELLNIYNKIKEDDNPILFIAEMK